MGWIQVRNFCLDSDPELGKFKAGSGSTTLLICLTVNMQHFWRVMINNIPASASRGALIFASLVKNFKIVYIDFKRLYTIFFILSFKKDHFI